MVLDYLIYFPVNDQIPAGASLNTRAIFISFSPELAQAQAVEPLLFPATYGGSLFDLPRIPRTLQSQMSPSNMALSGSLPEVRY